MLTSARCVNACGKLPSWRRAAGSYSSDEQADVVAQVEQPLEQLAGLVVPPLQRERVGEPERARQEHALAGREAVDGAVAPRPVAEHEAVRPSARAGSRRPSTRTAGRSAARNPTSGIRSSARVELVGAVRLRERLLALAPRALEHLGVDLVAERAPAVDRPVEAELLVVAHGAVERHPRHHLRVREVPQRPAHLPDPGVRLAASPSSSHSSSFRSSDHATSSELHARQLRLVQRRRAPRRRRRAGAASRPRCRPAPASTPRSPGATRARARRAAARRRAPYMIWRSAGSPATARSSQLAPRSRLVAVAGAAASRAASASRRGASSSGSPSCAGRRSAPAARWSAPRRCRRSGRTSGPSAPAATGGSRRGSRRRGCTAPPSRASTSSVVGERLLGVDRRGRRLVRRETTSARTGPARPAATVNSETGRHALAARPRPACGSRARPGPATADAARRSTRRTHGTMWP